MQVLEIEIIAALQAMSTPLLAVAIYLGWKGLGILHRIDLRLTKLETKMERLQDESTQNIAQQIVRGSGH
jgi:hypothetical protein